jgi:hypothetical protein
MVPCKGLLNPSSKKQQEAASNESAMLQLFELESSVYEKGSRKYDYSDDFELLSEVKRILLENSE